MSEHLFEPISSLELAAYMIRLCAEKSIPTNITKTQKLVYCAYGAVLGKFGCRLVTEYPTALEHGPVFTELLAALQFFKPEGFLGHETPEADALPDAVKAIIGETVTTFGQHEPLILMNWLMSSGTPWHQATKGGKTLFGRIPDDVTTEWFRRVVLN